MRNLISIFLLLILVAASPQAAGTIHLIAGPVKFISLNDPIILVQQDFEGAGYDNSETWTESGTGTADEDYATSPAPLRGSQSLLLNLSGQNRTVLSPLFTLQDHIDVTFAFRFVGSLPVAGKLFFIIQDGSGAVVGRLEISSGSKLNWKQGTGSAIPTATIAADTTYYIKLTWAKGTGSNGTGTIQFNTTPVWSGSGTSFASFSNGTVTTQARRIGLGPENNSTWQGIFDYVRASRQSIGDNPT